MLIYEGYEAIILMPQSSNKLELKEKFGHHAISGRLYVYIHVER